MKKATAFLVLLFLNNLAIADCSAPELAFKKHDGNILGFKIIKLWDESEAVNINKDIDTLIKFGDYWFLVSAKNTDRRPIKLNIEILKILEMLLNNLKRSPHHLNNEEQVFTVSDIEAYDLSGDSKENLIFFNVSPGANVYSGAVGIIDGEWKTIINPTCY